MDVEDNNSNQSDYVNPMIFIPCGLTPEDEKQTPKRHVFIHTDPLFIPTGRTPSTEKKTPKRFILASSNIGQKGKVALHKKYPELANEAQELYSWDYMCKKSQSKKRGNSGEKQPEQSTKRLLMTSSDFEFSNAADRHTFSYLQSPNQCSNPSKRSQPLNPVEQNEAAIDIYGIQKEIKHLVENSNLQNENIEICLKRLELLVGKSELDYGWTWKNNLTKMVTDLHEQTIKIHQSLKTIHATVLCRTNESTVSVNHAENANAFQNATVVLPNSPKLNDVCLGGHRDYTIPTPEYRKITTSAAADPTKLLMLLVKKLFADDLGQFTALGTKTKGALINEKRFQIALDQVLIEDPSYNFGIAEKRRISGMCFNATRSK